MKTINLKIELQWVIVAVALVALLIGGCYWGYTKQIEKTKQVTSERVMLEIVYGQTQSGNILWVLLDENGNEQLNVIPINQFCGGS